MIPKIIHYCWFGKGLMPASQKACIESWKKMMPDYEIKRWDESNFDVNICTFTKDAYGMKMFSPVSDVARLHALYTEGGIYMDTDVEVFKRFDEYLNYDFFSAVEVFPDFYDNLNLLDENRRPLDTANIFTTECGMLAAVLGAMAGNSLIKETLDYFHNQPFVFSDDTINMKIVHDAIIAHNAMKYGFVYDDKKQLLDGNMLILPSDIFCCMEHTFTHKSVLIHHNAQSWLPKTKRDLVMLKLDKLHLLPFYKKCGKAKRKLLSFFR